MSIYNEESNVIDRQEVIHIQRAEIEQCYNKDLVIQTAKGFLLSMLTSKGGLSIEEGEVMVEEEVEKEEKVEKAVKTKAIDPFREYLKEVFDPLIDPVFTTLLRFGVLVAAINTVVDRSTKKKKKIVTIVPPKYYKLEIITLDDFTVKYKIHPQEGLNASTQLMVFTHPGYEPESSTGRFRSMLAPCVDSINSIRRVQELNLDALHQRAHPPVALVKKEDASNLAESMALNSTDAEEKIFNIRKDKKSYEIREYYHEQMDSRAKIRKVYPSDSDYNGKKAIANGYGRMKMFYPTVVDNVHRIPFGWEISNTQPPLPELVPDLNMQEQSHAEKMMALLRIPVAMVLSVQRNRTDITQRIDDADFEMMEKTIGFWKKIILEFFETVYALMFTGKKLKEIKFSLPTITFINSTSLYQLYNQNIINLQTLQKKIIEINNLDEGDIADKPNIIDRPPVGGSYNDTTLMIDATVKNLNAQSKSVTENIKISQQMADTAEKSAQEASKKRKREESG